MLCLQSWKVSLKPSPLEKGSLINFKVRMPLVIRHKRYIIGTEGDGSAVMAQEVAEKIIQYCAAVFIGKKFVVDKVRICRLPARRQEILSRLTFSGSSRKCCK